MHDAAAAVADLLRGTTTAQALRVFDALPAVRVEEMTGAWRGEGVPTGHRLDGLLEAFGWHGKRFAGPEDAHPLVMDGGRYALDADRVPLALVLRAAPLLRRATVAAALRRAAPLLRTSRPRARLRMTEFRGVVSATMVYDALPVHDVFRRVDDATLLAVMDVRWDRQPFVFLLRREA